MQNLWMGLLVIFVIVEALTAGITTIWFAIGALGALIAAFCGAELWLQIVIFLAVSLLLLIFTRPLVKKFVLNKRERTNADKNIGKRVLVTQRIDPVTGTGYVKAGDVYWGAVAEDNLPIEEGEIVEILAITGNKFIVRRNTCGNNGQK
ncbi:MAG: NfeD family protein [Clostridiales bacterium]|nr:NfeD family protein [Clostridiales bacterium]